MDIKNVKWSHYTKNNGNQFVCLRLESQRRMRYIFFQVHIFLINSLHAVLLKLVFK